MTVRGILEHLVVTFVLAALSAAVATGLWSLGARASFRPDWPVAFTVAWVLGGIAVARDIAGARGGCSGAAGR